MEPRVVAANEGGDVSRLSAFDAAELWLSRLWVRRFTLGMGVLAIVFLVTVVSVHWAWASALFVAMVGIAAFYPRLGDAGDVGVAVEPAPVTGDLAPMRFSDPEGRIWRALIGGLSDPAFVVDGQRHVLVANGHAHSLWGIEAGRHLSEFVRAPELLGAVDQALAGQEPQTFQVRLAVPTERNLSGQVTPLGRASEGYPALAIVVRDQSEQDRLARMRADFVANASHELRTPLASLKGFVETLRGAAKDDAAARDHFLSIMQTDADRMARLIDDLLSLSRIEMRQHVAPRDTVDVADLARSVADGLATIAGQAGIAIVLRPSEGMTTVVGDRDDLAQLIQNLVQNAIKYGRRGGRVEIVLREEGPQIRLSVIDDGIGIAPENVPRLTERFYRVNAKQSRERGGTGLGLAIVKHIVNRHRGSLEVHSKLGEGSEFRVELPRSGLSQSAKAG